MTTSIPRPAERVRAIASVCGWTRSSTKNLGFLVLPAWIIAIASAAAVPSSRSEALQSSKPVRSVTIVWKFISDSRRPCDTSGWYGVYCVYHPGFSRTFRRITYGVFVS